MRDVAFLARSPLDLDLDPSGLIVRFFFSLSILFDIICHLFVRRYLLKQINGRQKQDSASLNLPAGRFTRVWINVHLL